MGCVPFLFNIYIPICIDCAWLYVILITTLAHTELVKGISCYEYSINIIITYDLELTTDLGMGLLRLLRIRNHFRPIRPLFFFFFPAAYLLLFIIFYG